MSSHTYIASQLLPGDGSHTRQHAFTRWMSRDLLQATTDFCKNIGLVALYAECSPENLYRYLLWRPPGEALVEIRSGRTRQTFEEFDLRNMDRNFSLLSLHVNEGDVYSAVWISTEHYDAAVAMLAAFAITPAVRKTAA